MNTQTFTAALRHRLTGRRGAKLLLCAAGAAAIASATLGSPASAITGVTGTGTPLCRAGWHGVMTFSPALQTGGTATSVLVTLNASFAGCAGGTPTPTGGSYVAKGVVSGTNANDCANWIAAPSASALVNFNQAPLRGSVSWSPATINPSNASFTAMQIFTGGAGRLFIDLPGTGTSVVTGSYVPSANLALRVVPSQSVALTDCGTGLAHLKIVPIAPPNHHSQGTW